MLILIILLQVAIFAFGMYFLFVAAAGLFTVRRPLLAQTGYLRFAVIVPAHNEEKVIGKVVENLKDLSYPPELYDIHVIADHCSDKTALVAQRLGVTVWERNNGERGKGRSLKEVLDKLGFVQPGNAADTYDAVLLIDADNLASPDILQVMNRRLYNGEKLIQCSIDSKNPDDNWVTSVFTVNFWINNRFVLQARHNLGLSTLTAGTGVCIAREVLQKTGGWDTTTITEDLEFAVLSLLHGFKATFARETRVYDEKPLSFVDACRQRLRWARGQLNVAFKYIPRLLKRGIVERDLLRIEGAMRLMQLPVIAAGMLIAALAPVLPELFRDTSLYYQVGHSYPAIAVFFASVPYLLPLLAMLLDRLSVKPYRYFVFYPLFYLSWIGIIIYALFTFYRQIWVPTDHTRDLDHQTILARLEANRDGVRLPRLRHKLARMQRSS